LSYRGIFCIIKNMDDPATTSTATVEAIPGPAVEAPPAGVQKKVMLIEDDRFLSSLIKARLEKDGFAVLQAFDGDEAVTMLKTEVPNLFILDLIMPKVNGFEVLKTISLTPGLERIPVVIVSNLAQDSDIEKAKQLGAKEYFVKVKISIDDLVAKIKTLAQ
jgi:DNA-binding response OmpR family regulator